MLLERCVILTEKNGNLALLSKSLNTKILSLIVKSRLIKNVSLCSTFSSSSLGDIFLKDLKNLSSLMAQRSSINLFISW